MIEAKTEEERVSSFYILAHNQEKRETEGVRESFCFPFSVTS
jgi:hypothetical protein